MPAVESLTSFKISVRKQRKKTNKSKLPLNSKSSLQENQKSDKLIYITKKNLKKILIKLAVEVATVISCITFTNSRMRAMNPIFLPLIDRNIAPTNDSFCAL
jgi:hypothetical protein